MKAKVINSCRIEGRVFGHKLAEKTVQNKESANFGKPFINGTLDIATDDACLNVVSINFTYVTPTTKTGAANATYAALKTIMGGKNVTNDGVDNALKVRVNTNLGLNDFYNRDGELVSAKRCDGGFVTVISSLGAEHDRNRFDMDMYINNVIRVEADPEKNIDKDYIKIAGAVFNFRNDILPVEFVVRDDGGMNYFESLGVSKNEPVFTRVKGAVTSQKVIRRIEEECAWDAPSVREVPSTVKEWTVDWAAPETYEFGNASTGVTREEITKAMQDRETRLAAEKARQEAYQASKNAAGAFAPAAGGSGVTAADGGFNF